MVFCLTKSKYLLKVVISIKHNRHVGNRLYLKECRVFFALFLVPYFFSFFVLVFFFSFRFLFNILSSYLLLFFLFLSLYFSLSTYIHTRVLHIIINSSFSPSFLHVYKTIILFSMEYNWE